MSNDIYSILGGILSKGFYTGLDTIPYRYPKPQKNYSSIAFFGNAVNSKLGLTSYPASISEDAYYYYPIGGAPNPLYQQSLGQALTLLKNQWRLQSARLQAMTGNPLQFIFGGNVSYTSNIDWYPAANQGISIYELLDYIYNRLQTFPMKLPTPSQISVYYGGVAVNPNALLANTCYTFTCPSLSYVSAYLWNFGMGAPGSAQTAVSGQPCLTTDLASNSINFMYTMRGTMHCQVRHIGDKYYVAATDSDPCSLTFTVS